MIGLFFVNLLYLLCGDPWRDLLRYLNDFKDLNGDLNGVFNGDLNGDLLGDLMGDLLGDLSRAFREPTGIKNYFSHF